MDDGFTFGTIEGEAASTDTVVEGQLASESGGEGESVDGGDTGAEGGGDASHSSRAGKEEDALGAELVGKVNAGGDDSVRLAFRMNFFFVADRARAFDSASHAVENFKAGTGIFSGGGFSGEHDGIGPLKNCVSDVGDFGPGGKGIRDHAFEHMGGDDDRLHRGDALFDDSALDDGKFLVGAFDAEIASGHHDGVGSGDDAEDVFDGELVFDLSDDFDVLGFVFV